MGETSCEILSIKRDPKVFVELGLNLTDNSAVSRPSNSSSPARRLTIHPLPVTLSGMQVTSQAATAEPATIEAQALAPALPRQHCHFYTHDALIDLMIARPGLFRHELAAHFGRTTVWLKNVMSADSFRAKYHARVGEMVDPLLQDGVKTRFDVMLNRSLEVLQAKLEKPADQVSDGLVLKAIELGAKAGAIGGFGQVAPPASNTAAEAEERLRRLHANLTGIGAQLAGEIVDVAVVERKAEPANGQSPV